MKTSSKFGYNIKDKLWDSLTMKNYSPMNKTQWKATTWTSLKGIILHKRKKTQSNTSSIISIIYNSIVILDYYLDMHNLK